MAVSGIYGCGDQPDRQARLVDRGAGDRGASGAAPTENQGAHEIRAALRELAPHVVVQVVTDIASVERPFGVPFQAGNEMPPEPTTTAAPLLDWAAQLGRKLGRR
jgi:hypothetical protein